MCHENKKIHFFKRDIGRLFVAGFSVRELELLDRLIQLLIVYYRTWNYFGLKYDSINLVIYIHEINHMYVQVAYWHRMMNVECFSCSMTAILLSWNWKGDKLIQNWFKMKLIYNLKAYFRLGLSRHYNLPQWQLTTLLLKLCSS